MTFDTFDTYNTDEAYNDKGTTAKGLVAAYKKDNPEGTKDDFYSKLNKTWAQDKDGYVKNAVDEAFKVETPATETKPTEEKAVEEVVAEEPKKESNSTTSEISKKDKNFYEKQAGLADNAEDSENERQGELELSRYDDTLARMKRSGEGFKNIDDHLLEQLPTFLYRRYQNGEFGNVGEDATPEEKKDAKLRFAHFMLNGVQSKLKNASNAAMVAAGRSPMFADTQSDWEKYQQSNLASGMENRWNKYKQETDAAAEILRKQNMDEQEIQSSIAKVSANARLQSAFNMMNENQKVYTLQVLSKIGNEIGNMNNKDFINTLIGFATSGDNLTWQEAAELLVARFGPDALKGLKNIKDEEPIEDGKDSTAGVSNITGRVKGDITLSDGTVVKNPGTGMSDDEFDAIAKVADRLRADYQNGKIDQETFNSDYQKLESLMKGHPLFKFFKGNLKTSGKSMNEVRKEKIGNLNVDFDDLQKNYKKMKPEEYSKKFDDLMSEFETWGVTGKSLDKLKKKKKK